MRFYQHNSTAHNMYRVRENYQLRIYFTYP